MTRIIEFRFNAKGMGELFRDVQAKIELKPETMVVSAIFFADKVEAGAIGYKIPAKLLRRRKDTKERIDIDGFVTIPYGLILSTVEYDWDEDNTRPSTGFLSE